MNHSERLNVKLQGGVVTTQPVTSAMELPRGLVVFSPAVSSPS